MTIMRRICGLFLLGAMILLGSVGLSGCAHDIPMTGNLEPSPAITRIPATVGVYYSPEFKTYEHRGARGGDIWVFPIGPASVRMFDRLFPVLFEGAFPVDRRPPLPEGLAKRLDGVVEVRIEGFDFGLPLLKNGTYTAEVTYRVILYSTAGDSLVSLTVQGFGSKAGEFGFGFARWPGEAADLAVQDAGTKLMNSFGNAPEVKHWLKQVGK